VCEPDISGDLNEESAAGQCICNGALGPARLNLDVNDLWWHEIHWVFSFSPAANGGMLTHGLDDPELYVKDPVLNSMQPMKVSMMAVYVLKPFVYIYIYVYACVLYLSLSFSQLHIHYTIHLIFIFIYNLHNLHFLKKNF
jgi:hypothetical protein